MASVVGTSVERTDGEAKVTGEAIYGVDYVEVGTLHAKLLRSPLPAGRITRLDVDDARALPGVRAVYTAADAPAHAAGWLLREQHLFASDVVRYEGEPIAMVVAESVHTAREALRTIRLEIEPEPAVGDMESALAEGARLVHPDWESYEVAGPEDYPRHGNVAAETISDPDPEAFANAFETADLVVEDEFRTPRQYQAYLEPKSALARYENGRYIVHTASQYPFNVRDRVAQYLGVRPSDVRVVGHHIGGGFGAKLDAGLEPYAAFAAGKLRRPVKIVNDRGRGPPHLSLARERDRAAANRPRRRRADPRPGTRMPDGQRRLQRRDAVSGKRADARAGTGVPRRSHPRHHPAPLHEYGADGRLPRRRRPLPLLRARAAHGQLRAASGPRPAGVSPPESAPQRRCLAHRAGARGRRHPPGGVRSPRRGRTLGRGHERSSPRRQAQGGRTGRLHLAHQPAAGLGDAEAERGRHDRRRDCCDRERVGRRGDGRHPDRGRAARGSSGRRDRPHARHRLGQLRRGLAGITDDAHRRPRRHEGGRRGQGEDLLGRSRHDGGREGGSRAFRRTRLRLGRPGLGGCARRRGAGRNVLRRADRGYGLVHDEAAGDQPRLCERSPVPDLPDPDLPRSSRRGGGRPCHRTRRRRSLRRRPGSR